LIVSVGRLVPVKRHDLLIRAAAHAREQVPDLRLRIIGEGYEREALETLIAQLGAHEWIELTGYVEPEELVRSYQEAWVVASASSHEGWGMTITEAGACGAPAVVSDIPGHADAVEHGETGLLCLEEELAPALADILQDHDLRQRLAAGAAARSGRLTWDATAERLLQLLVAQHPPR